MEARRDPDEGIVVIYIFAEEEMKLRMNVHRFMGVSCLILDLDVDLDSACSAAGGRLYSSLSLSHLLFHEIDTVHFNQERCI